MALRFISNIFDQYKVFNDIVRMGMVIVDLTHAVCVLGETMLERKKFAMPA